MKGDLIGVTSASCPYCTSALETFPTRKAKCRHCGKCIYVRSRPADRAKILLRDDQLEELDQQWGDYHEARRLVQRWGPEFDTAREALAAEFGSPPRTGDVTWSLLMREMERHALDMNWGFFRNTKLEMAKQLLDEHRTKQGMEMLLEVCYLDLNGPENRGNITDARLLEEFPRFDVQGAFLAPGVIATLNDAISELGLNESELHESFVRATGLLARSVDVPVSPETAWSLLAQALKDAKGPAVRGKKRNSA